MNTHQFMERQLIYFLKAFDLEEKIGELAAERDVSACRQFLALQRQDLASLFENGEELLAQVLEPGSDSAVDLVVVFRGLLQAHEESPPEKRAQELVEEISEKYEDELRAQFEPWEKVDPSESDALENAFWEPLIEVEDRAMSWIIFAFKSYIGRELLRGLGEVSERLDPDLVLLYPYFIEIQSRKWAEKLQGDLVLVGYVMRWIKNLSSLDPRWSDAHVSDQWNAVMELVSINIEIEKKVQRYEFDTSKRTNSGVVMMFSAYRKHREKYAHLYQSKVAEWVDNGESEYLVALSKLGKKGSSTHPIHQMALVVYRLLMTTMKVPTKADVKRAIEQCLERGKPPLPGMCFPPMDDKGTWKRLFKQAGFEKLPMGKPGRPPKNPSSRQRASEL